MQSAAFPLAWLLVAAAQAMEVPLQPGKGGSMAGWRLDRILPEDPTASAHWIPLPWTGDQWYQPERTMAGAPAAMPVDGGVKLHHRSGYDGSDVNTSDKLVALTFIAPEAGVWRLVGELRTKRFEGLGPVHLDIFWRRPGSASVAALATWPLVPDGMVPLEVGPIRMERGNELALLPRCTWRQSGLFATFRHCSAQTVVVP